MIILTTIEQTTTETTAGTSTSATTSMTTTSSTTTTAVTTESTSTEISETNAVETTEISVAETTNVSSETNDEYNQIFHDIECVCNKILGGYYSETHDIFNGTEYITYDNEIGFL